MHLKRQTIPKSWPVFRKGTKYIIKPGFNAKEGIPILVVLRDLLGVAQNRKEVKKALHLKNVLINNKPASNEKNSVLLFDTIGLVPMKKYYRLSVKKGGNFSAEEISEKDSGKKIVKVVNKKILKGKKAQLNFSDGKNLVSDTKCKMNDSVLIDVQGKKIEKVLPLENNANVFVFSGKHAGKKGNVVKLDNERKTVQLDIEGKQVNVLIKQLITIE